MPKTTSPNPLTNDELEFLAAFGGSDAQSSSSVTPEESEELSFTVFRRHRPMLGDDSDEEEEAGKTIEGKVPNDSAPLKKERQIRKRATQAPKELPPIPLSMAFLYTKKKLTRQILPELAENTNAYAVSKEAGESQGSRLWERTSKDELRIFIGIIIYMGVFQSPAVSDYWSTSHEFPQLNITNFMTLLRFQQLKRFFTHLPS
ncbi:hypothetical protein BG000_002042 [Podila horticola]|nr:hypothetical protein BG000_002042 [Podila horticola]